jgi:hypothetical protein
MCPSLLDEQFDRFYQYSAFKSLSIMGQCPVDANIPAPEIGAIQMNTRKQNSEFTENGLIHFH